MEAEAVEVGRLRKMRPVLIQRYIFGKVVEILVLAGPIADACIAALDIGRPDESKRIRYD